MPPLKEKARSQIPNVHVEGSQAEELSPQYLSFRKRISDGSFVLRFLQIRPVKECPIFRKAEGSVTSSRTYSKHSIQHEEQETNELGFMHFTLPSVLSDCWPLNLCSVTCTHCHEAVWYPCSPGTRPLARVSFPSMSRPQTNNYLSRCRPNGASSVKHPPITFRNRNTELWQ